MKLFIKKILIIGLSIGIVSVLFCVYIDPYNVFHPNVIRDNGVEPNKNYLKMRNILKNPDWFDSFLFGSSRVGSIHVENISDRFYNMTYSEGTPCEAYKNIQTLINNGVNVKTIFLGVDSISYTINPEEHLTKGLQARYEQSIEKPYEFWKLYLDPAVALESLDIILNYQSDGFEHDYWVYNFYHYGWTIGYGSAGFDENEAYPVIGKSYRLEETLNEIEEIVNLCKEKGIELVVFTNPMYYLTFEESLKYNYYEFLQKLAEITPYYNFSGYSYLSTNATNFTDPSHYSAEVGDIMINMMIYQANYDFYLDQGFGMYVDKSNITDLFRRLNVARDTFLKENRWP